MVPKETHLTASHLAGQLDVQGLDGRVNLNADMGYPVRAAGVRGGAVIDATGKADVILEDVVPSSGRRLV